MHIFFDIDNTLISHKGIPHVPPETYEALKLLRNSGHTTAIATGRGAFLTFLAAKELGINNIVCSGGAQIFVNGKEIHRVMFPDKYIHAFLKVAQKFPALTAAIDDKFLYASEAFSPYFEYFNAQAGYNCIRPISELCKAIICYIIIPPANLTHEHGLFFSPPEDVKLELMHAFTEARCEGTSKWLGIEKLIAHEKANINDAIVFGDGPNDIDMLEHAKIGVAVGNASDIVKSAADYVCDDIDSGGILSACKYLGLI